MPFYHFYDIFQFIIIYFNLMQTQKSKIEISRPRVEIKADFSKELKELSSEEMNTVVNNFRRHKVMQMDKLREGNPLFGMSPTSHHFNRDKILELLGEVIKGPDISQERIDDDYGEALNIVDWYNEEREKYLKETKTKEFTAQK